eukprot:jgi/Bigna1/143160/aug1.76_g17868
MPIFPRAAKMSNPTAPRVAIVGAGWTGLVVAARLQQRSFEVEIFEREDDVGGTWHRDNAYEAMRTHGPAWAMEIDGFPLAKAGLSPMTRPSAKQVRTYLRLFREEHQLKAHFNCNIKGVDYDSKSRKADLLAENVESKHHGLGKYKSDERKREKRFHGFDFVLLTANASSPWVPDFVKRSPFKGRVYHTQEISDEKVDELLDGGVNNKRRLVVVGGSQSALERVVRLAKLTSDCGVKKHQTPTATALSTSSNNSTPIRKDSAFSQNHEVIWLYEKPYLFMKYETLIYSSPLDYVRGFTFFMLMIMSPFLPSLSLLGLWLTGSITTPSGFSVDADRFHLGTVDKSQLELLSKVKRIRGYAAGLTEHGVKLRDGRVVQADSVIFGTGFMTGNNSLRVFKDGKKVVVKKALLYHHLVDTRLPLGYSCNPQYFSGPNRSKTIADNITSYLSRAPSQKEMEATVKAQMITTNSERSSLFDSEQSFISVFVLSLGDLWFAGALSLLDVLHAFAAALMFHKSLGIRGVASHSRQKKQRQQQQQQQQQPIRLRSRMHIIFEAFFVVFCLGPLAIPVAISCVVLLSLVTCTTSDVLRRIYVHYAS